MKRNNKHIEKAKEYLHLAVSEFKKAKKKNNIELLQNACAKAWFAASEALYAFLVNKGFEEKKLPKTDRGKRYTITKYGDKEFRRHYFSLRESLHIEGYYEGKLTFDDFQVQIEDLKDFINKQNFVKNTPFFSPFIVDKKHPLSFSSMRLIFSRGLKSIFFFRRRFLAF